jgi:SsrA-binding protein
MAAKQKQVPPAKDAIELVARNKRVHHDYEVVDTVEAGLVLIGSEVKSLRAKDVQWGDAHGRVDRKGEMWLYGLYLGEYKQAGAFGHAPTRQRKVLLHRHQLDRMSGATATKGLTVVPLAIYFKKGRAKVELALCRGKAKGDKRKDLVQKSQQRDIDREIARRMRAG